MKQTRKTNNQIVRGKDNSSYSAVSKRAADVAVKTRTTGRKGRRTMTNQQRFLLKMQKLENAGRSQVAKNIIASGGAVAMNATPIASSVAANNMMNKADQSSQAKNTIMKDLDVLTGGSDLKGENASNPDDEILRR